MSHDPRRLLTLRLVGLAELSKYHHGGDHKKCVKDNFSRDGVYTNIFVESAVVDGSDILATILVDPKEWLRQCAQVSAGVDKSRCDEYFDRRMRELESQLPPGEIAELVQWLGANNIRHKAFADAFGGLVLNLAFEQLDGCPELCDSLFSSFRIVSTTQHGLVIATNQGTIRLTIASEFLDNKRYEGGEDDGEDGEDDWEDEEDDGEEY